MKIHVLVFAVISSGTGYPTLSQNCDTAHSIPAGHKKVGSGSATVEYEGTSTVSGGQAVYVRLKNDNVLGVSYSLTIAQNATPEVPLCTYKAALPPKTSAILYGGVFAEPPISYKVIVTVGDESNTGVITFEVYSKPVTARQKSLGALGFENSFYLRRAAAEAVGRSSHPSIDDTARRESLTSQRYVRRTSGSPQSNQTE